MTTWTTPREAAAMFLRGATARAASRIALVVGTWLTAVNQWAAIREGHPPWTAIALNYATPFVVASLGFLAARRRSTVEALAASIRDEER